ncbi:MAG: hypothetical protein QNK35_05435 [Bacteroides sp.]|nr:hypothetical protein [Bacteroides sp.]
MKLELLVFWIGLMLLVSCDENITEVYPDEPVVDYQGFGIYLTEDALGNQVVMGRITFDFTDGDGNLGLPSLDENTNPILPDSLKYNFYLQLYDLQGYEYVEIPESEGGFLKYRIPFLNKQPLKGTMDLDITYPVIVYDTIFYTFYIVDRDFNRSNTDTTDVIVLSGIDLNQL